MTNQEKINLCLALGMKALSQKVRNTAESLKINIIDASKYRWKGRYYVKTETIYLVLAADVEKIKAALAAEKAAKKEETKRKNREPAVIAARAAARIERKIRLQKEKEEQEKLEEKNKFLKEIFFLAEVLAFRPANKALENEIINVASAARDRNVLKLLKIGFDMSAKAKEVNPGYFWDFVKDNFDSRIEAQEAYDEARTESRNYYKIKELAVKIATKLLVENNQGFSFGKKEDVVYFEKSGKQVSYHGCIAGWMPSFGGSWNGIRNESFPF